MSNMGDFSSVKPCQAAMKKIVHKTLLDVEQYLLGLELEGGGTVASALDLQPIPDILTRSEASSSNASVASNASAGPSSSAPRVPKKSSSRVSFRLDPVEEDKPSRQVEGGVVLDLNVNVKRDGKKKNMKMAIECPQYKPKRIYYDGKPMDIVD